MHKCITFALHMQCKTVCKSYAKWYAKPMHLCNASILFIYLFIYFFIYICTVHCTLKAKIFFRHEEKRKNKFRFVGEKEIAKFRF